MAVQEKRIIIIYAFAKVRIKDFTYLRDLLLMGLGGAMGERYDVRDFRPRNLERTYCDLSFIKPHVISRKVCLFLYFHYEVVNGERLLFSHLTVTINYRP